MKTLTNILIICLSVFSIQAKAGGDYFKVYLNNKLILEKHVNDAFDLKQLQLDKSNVNDKLVFHYSHCGQIGNGRKIAVKDAKGNVVREWKFEDVSGKHSGMIIPVKELLQLKQDDLQFVYTAKELPKGQLIAALRLTDKTTSFHSTVPQGPGGWLMALIFRWNNAPVC